MIRSVTLLAILTAFLAHPVSAGAQTLSGGSVRGYVKDQQGAVLPAVPVSATSPDAPGVYSAVTDVGGVYRLVDLPPGSYTITAEHRGFAKFVRPNIEVRAGLNLNVDIVMTIGSVTETAEVKADTPLIESKTAEQTVNISGDLQRHVPLSTRRDWADALILTPGVVSVELSGGLNYFLHGADQQSMVMQFDGADLGSALGGRNFYIAIGNEAIGDVQVKTGGVDASTPLGQGAIMNVAMKSGTNQFKGTAAATYQPWRFTANNGPEGSTTSAFRLFQADASLGGPILRDRLWFFGTWRLRDDAQSIDRTATQVANLTALVPGWKPFTLDSTSNLYVAKVSAQAGRHQVSGFVQYDGYQFDPASATTGAIYQTRHVGGIGTSIRASSVWGSSVMTQVSATYNDKGIPSEALRNDLPQRNVHPRVSLAGGRLVGSGSIALLDNQFVAGDSLAEKMTFTGDLTWYRTGLGSHEIRTGVYVQPLLRTRQVFKYVNNGFVVEDVVLRDPANAAGGTIPFHRQYRTEVNVVGVGNDGQDYAVYVQDSWKPLPRLTLSGGVRVDAIRRQDSVFNLETQSSVSIGPRVGINYGLTADGLNVVRAGWVRVHDLPMQTTPSIGSSTGGFRDTYDLDLNGTFETELFTPGVTAQTVNRRLDDSRNQPYLNEWIVGYRRQLPGQTSVDVSWIRREYRDRLAFQEINGIYEDAVFRGYRDPTFNDILTITNNIWNWPVYTGLEFQATKQTNRIQMIGGYTRQWRHIAGTWQPNDPASFIQPDAFANDKGIGAVAGNASATDSQNSLSGTSQAGAQQWVDHVVRLGASFFAPWGFTFATNYTFQSGLWVGPVVTRIAAADPRFGPATLTLSNGRVVSNPLATTNRFVFPTRGEGQHQLEPVHVWNLRVGRDFHVGSHRLETAVDIFNLTNRGDLQSWQNGSNQTFSPNYKIGFQRQQPRAAQVVIRFVF